jgi:hypothetical protein
MAWGDSKYGGSGAPSDNGYTKIYSNFQAFAALKANGSSPEGAFMPPRFESPQAMIEPSALRAAKANLVE